jgi:DNA-binding CsgD family transcriptional regulator
MQDAKKNMPDMRPPADTLDSQPRRGADSSRPITGRIVKNAEPPAPKTPRQMFYDLYAQKIELKMQSEELQRLQARLKNTGAQLTNPYDPNTSEKKKAEFDGHTRRRAVRNNPQLTMCLIVTDSREMASVLDALRLDGSDCRHTPRDTRELLFTAGHYPEKHLLGQLDRQNLQVEEERERRKPDEEPLRENEETELKSVQFELERQMKERTTELYETNIALKILLKKREEDKKALEGYVMANIEKLVEPFLTRLEESRLTEQQQELVGILRSNIEELTSPFAEKFTAKLTRLTPVEIQVANLVKLGKSTKEIAQIMHLSAGTISIHRKNIRKKLDLTHQKTNLQSILTTNLEFHG